MPKIARITLKRKSAGFVVSIHQYAARGRRSLHSRFEVDSRGSLDSPDFLATVQAANAGPNDPPVTP